MTEYHFQLESMIKPLMYFWRGSARRSGRLEVWCFKKDNTSAKYKTYRLLSGGLNIAVAVAVIVVIVMLSYDCAVVCTLRRAEINASDSSCMHNDVRIKVANVQPATFTAAGQYRPAPPAVLHITGHCRPLVGALLYNYTIKLSANVGVLSMCIQCRYCLCLCSKNIKVTFHQPRN